MKTGPATVDLEAHSIVFITADQPTKVFLVNDQGEENLLFTTTKKRFRFRVQDKPITLTIDAEPLQHWDIDVIPAREKGDPIPVEIPEEMMIPETLEEKMRRMISSMAAHMYGANNPDVETLEEAMDLDLNDDGEIFSGYEVTTLADETPPAEPPPAAAEPVPPTPATPAEPEQPGTV